jgi:DNA replication protein DnaC
MLLQQTLDLLYTMKLNAMAEGFKEQMNQADIQELSFEERFSLLVDRQWNYRENRKIKRLLDDAKLKLNACIEDIDFKAPRGLDKSVILRLADCRWIQNAENVIITGPTGGGKTYIACALANKACRMALPAFYIRIPRLFQQLGIAKADGSYAKVMKRLLRTKVLILDDFGLAPLAQAERHDLLEIIEDRHGISSTIVTTQLPTGTWHDAIKDPTIADAILDRLIHNAHKITLKGEESMRKIRSSLTNKRNSEK